MAHVQVILTEKIAGLGAEADLVSVRGGFARNFLLPQGLALEATRGNRRHTEALKSKRVAREAAELAAARETAAGVANVTLRLELSTGQVGKSFGSITNQDIAKAAKEQAQLEIDRHAVVLEKPIRAVGEYVIELKLHPEVTASVNLVVESK